MLDDTDTFGDDRLVTLVRSMATKVMVAGRVWGSRARIRCLRHLATCLNDQQVQIKLDKILTEERLLP